MTNFQFQRLKRERESFISSLSAFFPFVIFYGPIKPQKEPSVPEIPLLFLLSPFTLSLSSRARINDLTCLLPCRKWNRRATLLFRSLILNYFRINSIQLLFVFFFCSSCSPWTFCCGLLLPVSLSPFFFPFVEVSKSFPSMNYVC